MKKIQGLGKYFGILVMAGILIGCSNKYDVGSSESSAKILNSYVKKDAPEGWFYNFGIGPNYSLALKDATNSLSFRKPLSVETKVVTSMTGFRDKNGYRQVEPEKNVESTPYNVFSSDSKCEVIENWDVPEGTLIVRICPDLQYFKDNYQFDKSLLLSYDDSTKLGELEREFIIYAVQHKLNPTEIELFQIFKDEMMSFGYDNFIYNYGNLSNLELIGFILNEYNKWYNKIGFINRQNKVRMGIFYPHSFRLDTTKYVIKDNQFWLLDGVKVSRKLQLSDAQVLGYSPINDSSSLKFIVPKK